MCPSRQPTTLSVVPATRRHPRHPKSRFVYPGEDNLWLHNGCLQPRVVTLAHLGANLESRSQNFPNPFHSYTTTLIFSNEMPAPNTGGTPPILISLYDANPTVRRPLLSTTRNNTNREVQPHRLSKISAAKTPLVRVLRADASLLDRIGFPKTFRLRSSSFL